MTFKNVDVAGRHSATRSTKRMDVTLEKKPIQIVKMLNGANNKSKIICSFVFDLNIHSVVGTVIVFWASNRSKKKNTVPVIIWSKE